MLDVQGELAISTGQIGTGMDSEEEREAWGSYGHLFREVRHHARLGVLHRLGRIRCTAQWLGAPHQRDIAQPRSISRVWNRELSALRAGLFAKPIENGGFKNVRSRRGSERPL